jgi:hypothetical protein
MSASSSESAPPTPPSHPSAAAERPHRPRALLVLAGGLIAAAIVVPLLVWTYASEGPRLFGFPFFYWYQLMWVFLAAILTSLAYLIIEGRDRR